MKSIFILISFVVLAAGCQKNPIQQAQENVLLNAMTDGQWRIVKFSRAGNDITSDFAAYKFQYYAGNTVDAIKSGVVEKTGTWVSDINTQSMTITYANASYPLTLLTGTWKITNNSWTFVEGTQTVNGEVLTLRIEK